MTTYKLYYFNVTGLAEPIRFLLHYCGIKFEDVRFQDYNEWVNEYKKDMPMGQVPVLEIDGVKYHQHKAICKYIWSKKFDNLSSSPEESLIIDAIIDDIDDIRSAIGRFYNESNETVKTVLKDRLLHAFPFYLQKFEARLENNAGFFVNGKITLLDIYYAGISEIISSIMSPILGHDIHKNYPSLKQLVDEVCRMTPIKEYLKNRPKTDL